MEHRLCYQRMPERPAGRESGAEYLTPAEQRRRLDARIWNNRMQEAANWMNQPKAVQDRVFRDLENGVPAKLNSVVQHNKEAFSTPDGLRSTLLPQLAAQPSIQKNVEAMLNALTQDIAKGTSAHRYVITWGPRGKEGSWYGVDFARVAQDKQAVAQLKAAFPALGPQWNALDYALREFERQDPRLAMYDMNNAALHNPVDRTVQSIGRIGLVVAAGSMAMIMGVIGALNLREKGGRALAPFALYSGITLLLAQPRIAKQIYHLFFPDEQRALKEVDKTLNNKQFRDTSLEYNVRGASWKQLVSRIMARPEETKAFLRRIPAFGADPDQDERDILTYVRSNMTGSATEQQALIRMIKEGKFAPFARNLMNARHTESQKTVNAFVEQGLIEFERNTRAAAAAMDASPKAQPPRPFVELRYTDGTTSATPPSS